MEGNLTLSEKVTKLHNLVDALPESEGTRSVLSLIADILTDISDNMECMDDDIDELFDTVDSHSDVIDSILDYTEEDAEDESEGEQEDNSEAEDSEGDDDDVYFELNCPSCKERLFLTEADLQNTYECPYCGEMLDVSVEDDTEN